jgi:hypothetical protein
MAFDVEAARKAGYTDAEIAAHLAQSRGYDLAGAKKSGYTDGEVIAHLSAKRGSMADQIPVGMDEQGRPLTNAQMAARLPAPVAQPEPTVGQKLLGTGEAALTTVTGATGGTIGMIGGTLKGLAEQILAGQFGTQEAAKLVAESAAGGAQMLTYAPRTQSGQDQVEVIGRLSQDLVPVAGVAPALMMPRAAAGAGMRPAAPAGVLARTSATETARAVAGNTGAAAVEGVIKGADRVADLARTGATTLPRRALEALRRTDEPQATPGTMGSAGAAGADMALQRTATAESLPVPIRLTRGQASRDPAQLKFEVETAKLPEQGAPLRARIQEQNDALLRNFDVMLDQSGAEAPSLRAAGAAVDQALVKQAARDKAQYRVTYKAAEQAGELEAPVSLANLVQHLNDAAPEAATAPVLTTARAKALQLGVATEQNGQLVPAPVPLKTAELFRQSVNRATNFEPTNIRQATIMKGLVDDATNGLGGNLYRQARSQRARYAQNYEDRAVVANLMRTRKGTSDRAVALEDVFSSSILKGSLDDVRNMRRVLQRGGDDGMQAWRELQGATVNHIRDAATRSVAKDGTGNSVISPAALDRAVRDLDVDGRLDFVLGKQGAQRMRDINDLAQYVKTVPPEAAINTSNTASTLMAALLDAGVIGGTGGAVPVPVASLVRAARQTIQDRALRRRIEAALADAGRRRRGASAAPTVKPQAEARP